MTPCSDGGDVALHAYVLMLEPMEWGAQEARPALRAGYLQPQADDAHADVGGSVFWC